MINNMALVFKFRLQENQKMAIGIMDREQTGSMKMKKIIIKMAKKSSKNKTFLLKKKLVLKIKLNQHLN